MKKITILVDQLNSHGGIEKLVALKANYWATVFKYEVTIISTEQFEKPVVYELSEKIKFKDLAINFNRNKSYFSFANVLKFIKNVIAIQTHLLKDKPDFVLVASHIPITYFLPFLFRSSKIIKEFHFTKFERIHRNDFKSKLLNYIEGRYDFLLVLSPEEKTFYKTNNVVVIANPIDTQNPTLHPILNNEKIAVFVGRFAAVKQLESLVEIWTKFVEQNKSWKLHIFGTIGNDYFKKIKQLVDANHMNDFIVFKGQSEQILNEIAKSKVLLLTSEQECFPMVILEANSVGIPVISFDCPTGPRNSMHHNVDGILVEHNNVDVFVNELIRFDLDTNLQEKLSENAKENAKKYTIDLIMNQWNDLIFKKDG